MNNFTENVQDHMMKAKIFSIHTIYNRYIQKATKGWFKSTADKKDQDQVELFQDRIAVSPGESITPF